MMKRLLPVILSLTLTFAATFSLAQEKAMGVVTGAKTGTYFQVGKDIAQLAGKEKVNLKLRESGGSIDNLQLMVKSKENAALGVVQADVLSFLLKSDKPKSKEISKKVRAIAPLFKEEIHILADRSIKTIDDLNDKKVVVGNAGSGSMMTSINLFSLYGVKPAKMFQVDAPEAIVAVLAGRADAMIFVGGKPVPMFKNLEQLKDSPESDMNSLLEKVHFLPLSDEKVGKTYEAATITPDDYGFVQDIIPTLAVRAVLVGYDFTLKDTAYYGMRCRQLGQLGSALRSNLSTLQQSGHEKWKEVDFSQDLPLWKRDECAWPKLKPQAQVAAKTAPSPATPAKKAPAATPENAPAPDRTQLEKELLELLSQ